MEKGQVGLQTRNWDLVLPSSFEQLAEIIFGAQLVVHLIRNE